MSVTDYYTIEGTIIGESTAGVHTDYLTDAMGSVTATVNQSATMMRTFRYYPYGGTSDSTGNSGPDPKFKWIGSRGYRNSSDKYSNYYIRARHYGSDQGAWSTIDPLWPSEPAYGYVRSNPTTLIDVSGKEPNVSIFYCKRYDYATIRNSIDFLCSNINGNTPAKNIDCCLGAEVAPEDSLCTGEFSRYAYNHPRSFQMFCEGKDYVEIECVMRLGRGDCEDYDSEQCAYTQKTLTDPEIVMCGSSLWYKHKNNPQKGCKDTECVVWHELMHWFKYSHESFVIGGGGGGGSSNSSGVQCCCFNCIRKGRSNCDGYFAFGDTRGSQRYKAADCNTNFGTTCP